MSLRLVAPPLLLLVACSLGGSSGSTSSSGAGAGAGGGGGGGANGTTSGGSHAADPYAAAGDGIVVHEWGTFTSVARSTGLPLEGLQHEEEPLPQFVYQRALTGQGSGGGKGMENAWCVSGVTQKLETPVLFFYANAEKSVHVHVDFPRGIVSQWYPGESTFGPAVDPNTAPTVAGGFMEWTADAVPGLSGFPTPNGTTGSVWNPSREVPATPVRVVPGGALPVEQENFIFYRGVGAFDVPLHVRSSASAIAIDNGSAQAVPAAFLMRVGATTGTIAPLGGVGAGSTLGGVAVPPDGAGDPLDAFVLKASGLVAAALEQSGLTRPEAHAMVQTWAHSYFRSPGLRVLYVVPREWTDALLPIRIDPQPNDLVRTLVGRVEVLTPGEESSIVSMVTTAAQTSGDPTPQLGRFAEPKLRRAAELITDPNVSSYVQSLVGAATKMP